MMGAARESAARATVTPRPRLTLISGSDQPPPAVLKPCPPPPPLPGQALWARDAALSRSGTFRGPRGVAPP